MAGHRHQGWSRPPPVRPASRHRRFPRWRPLTWVILAFNLLMPVWLVVGVSAASDSGEECVDELCRDANDVGTAIGAGVVLFIWMAGAVILGVIWLVTNKSSGRAARRQPPQRW